MTRFQCRRCGTYVQARTLLEAGLFLRRECGTGEDAHDPQPFQDGVEYRSLDSWGAA